MECFEKKYSLKKNFYFKAIYFGWFLFFIINGGFILNSKAQIYSDSAKVNNFSNQKNANDTTIKIIPSQNGIIISDIETSKEKNKELFNKNNAKITKLDTAKRIHSPGKAALLSAILPGTGQIYNRKYWKAPLIYGTGAALGYFLSYNMKNYNIYKKAYIYRMDKDSTTVDVFQNYSEDWIKSERDRNRKNLEYTYIFTTFWYILNIVDASVDAHFFYFDVNDNLSMSVEPIVVPIYSFGLKNYNSIKLTLHF